VNGPRFLDPQVLARIDNLELVARTVVEGFLSGLHHSPYRGLSTDFAEHREYMPGDDIRRIDWRVFGRTDRFYVKEFEADTNANFVVLLDVSASMDYGSRSVTKLDYARFLGASLAYLSRRQRDRVGLVTFAEDVLEVVPASAKHLDIVLHTIDRVQPAGVGSLERSMAKIAEIIRRRSIVALLSDLYDEPDAVLEAIGPLVHRGADVIVFQILDPAEREFPFSEAAPFEDLETGLRMPVVPETLSEDYRTVMQRHVETLGRQLGERGVDYWMADTATPLDFTLFEYLSRRARLARVR
jgi:uncharacterized protein (DUF58 family)